MAEERRRKEKEASVLLLAGRGGAGKEAKEPPMVLNQLTNFLSGFTFPRNKKKISMTNSLGKQHQQQRSHRKSSCRSNSGERGTYGLLATAEDLRNSNRIRTVHNPIGSCSSSSSSNNLSTGRSRERRLSSSSATVGGGGGGLRRTEGTQELQQSQKNPKLVRIIDHQLDW